MDRQRNSTEGKQRQLGPFLGAMQKPSLVREELLSSCEDEHDAVLLCIHLSKLPHEYIAQTLGIDKGHWSRIVQGRAHFPTKKRIALMRLCGNYAPIQFEATSIGYKLFADETAAEEAELLDRLATVRARRVVVG
jgi:hypothetical protein